jgi:hypothetical protein
MSVKKARLTGGKSHFWARLQQMLVASGAVPHDFDQGWPQIGAQHEIVETC